MNPNFGTPNNNVIAAVVERGLCSGCGVCVGACPNKALTMAYLPNGDLAAQPSGNPCLSKCTICTSICPFAEGVLNPRQLNQAIFGPSTSIAHPEFHEDVGYYQGAFVGYSKAHRALSASGGLLTWTLESLLISGEIDCVAAVTCATGKDGRYTFTFTTAQTVDELRQCSGSIYHQVEISTIVERILDEPKRRWAITGVPCLRASKSANAH